MNNININKNTSQSGRSMIEMLGVLAIVGVLSVGGIAGYSKAMQKFKINKTAEQISHIVTSIRTLYAQQTSYEGLTENTAIEMGIIPTEMGTNAISGKILTSFKGQVYIRDFPYWGKNIFLINVTGLPKEACVSLSTHDWGSPSSSGLLALTISNGAMTGTNVGGFDQEENQSGFIRSIGKNIPLPLNVATAVNGCNCPDDNCTVGFTFQ